MSIAMRQGSPASNLQRRSRIHPPPLLVREYVGIELLRFVTAAAVLVFHYQHFYVGSVEPFDVTRQPFYSGLGVFYRYGYFGVQFFWCISGFIFFARYGRPVSSGQESFRRFSLARFSRLYPLHFLTLLVVAALQAIYMDRHGNAFIYQNNDLAHFAAQLGMVGSWQLASGPDTYSFNGPIWSVSLEIVAYLVFFAVTRLFGASSATVLTTFLAVIGFDALVGHHPVFSCVVYFYIGAGVFQLSRALSTTPRRRFALTMALAAGFAAAAMTNAGKLPTSIATLIIAPAALFVAAHSLLKSGSLLGRSVTALGNTTYASYLLHFPLQLMVVLIMELLAIDLPLSSAWFFSAYLIATFLVSILCYRFLERPAQQWLRLNLASAA